MLCLRSSIPGLSTLSSVLNTAPAALTCSRLMHYEGKSAKPKLTGIRMGSSNANWRANGEIGTPSLHGDLPSPAYRDDDRKANWRQQTDAIDRNAENNLPAYMVLGVGSGVTLYLAKYTLYGLALLLGPGRDKYAAAAIEVDVSSIPEGKNAVFTWRGKPLFIRHRTSEEIAAAQAADVSQLRDPQSDQERCVNEKFLICLGVCTHLGCVPIAHAGDWKGYYCPCHGSHYDTCARIMKGPAPLNLEVPKHEYLSEDLIIIGKED